MYPGITGKPINTRQLSPSAGMNEDVLRCVELAHQRELEVAVPVGQNYSTAFSVGEPVTGESLLTCQN